MDPKSLLLVFLGANVDAAPGQPVWPMDPVRIQKGLFLLSQEAPDELPAIYDFEPYMYGPFSSDIYRDLRSLESDGLVEGMTPLGYTWKHYALTPKGASEVGAMVGDLSTDALNKVREVRTFVSTRPFRQLLREVYARYPDYAQNSVVASSL